jgi:hypothetical protein
MLQKMLDDLLKQHKVLDVQVTRVNDDLRQSKHDAVGLEKHRQKNTDELLELTLENDSCHIELVKQTKVKEEALVASDVLKLQVESLKRLLSRRGEEKLGLDNRRQQLQVTIEERELEIKVHHDVLRMEAKTAEDERKTVAVELRDRKQQVDHLRNRFDVLIGRMDKGAGETTHAQHIVRTAKEREELQAAGDNLDGEIKRVDRESRKLDKTIAMLKGSNAKYKQQYSKVGEGDEEVVQSKMLQKKSKELQSIVNRRTNDMRDFMRTEMAAISELQERTRERDDVVQQIQLMQDGEGGLQRDIEEQHELVAQYDVAIGKARRVTEPEIVEDISLLEEVDKVESVVALLLQVAAGKEDDELLRHVEETLLQQDFQLPSDMPGIDDDEGDM